ncbi:MAG: hypothetical protein CMO80_21735 [Verrucomicrobiales bacterium]|nr:hypothetical protein [Verrucomicrobiales bacterium]
MRHAAHIVAIAWLAVLVGCGKSAGTGDAKLRKARAQELVANLARADYGSARTNFNMIMRFGLTEAALKKTWEGLQEQTGKFVKTTWTRETVHSGYNVVFVGCAFEKTTMKTKVVFAPGDRVTGLFFQPWTREWKAPYYVDESKFEEREVTFGDPEWQVEGTLTVPTDSPDAPVIMLVHGSGPHDRDQTIGPNKPFKDLAWGLASKGVAVLRYEKRTKAYQAKLAQSVVFTTKEETVDDAVLAVQFLSSKGYSNRVFLAGHSLGGHLAPRIADATDQLSGVIVLAGNARPLEELIVEQMEYVAKIRGKDISEQMEGMRLEVHRIKGLGANDRIRREVILGAPISYWLDLKDYRPIERAAKLKLPMLFLQGSRDYQVTGKDFELWQQGMKHRENVSFQMLENLNHLLISGEGKSEPIEYQNSGHVDQSVITAIVSWIEADRGN